MPCVSGGTGPSGDTHGFASCLALTLALVLGASGGHLLGVAIRDVEQHAWALLTAVGTGRVTSNRNPGS